MVCRCLWCQSVSSFTFCIQFYKLCMQSVVFTNFSHSNRPELTQFLVKLPREAHKKHMADSEKEKGNEAMSDDPLQIRASLPIVHQLMFCWLSVLCLTSERWIKISQHHTTRPLAFFPSQAFYSKDYQEAEVHLMCFAGSLFSHWQVFDKAWIICNSEPEFITSRNPEKLESNFETVDAVKINRSRSSYGQTYLKRGPWNIINESILATFFWYLGFRHPKKCARRTTVVVCNTWQMILPPGRIVPWSGTSESECQCQCCENPVGLGVVIILA